MLTEIVSICSTELFDLEDGMSAFVNFENVNKVYKTGEVEITA